jgi:hypothetical protein
MNRRHSIILGLTIALALTACSDDKGGAASTTTTSVAPSSTTTTAPALVMRADGLGPVKLGDAAEAALTTLQEQLGAPDEVRESSCAPTVTREADWGSLVVYLDATSVAGYLYLFGEEGPDLRTDTDLGAGAIVSQLRAAYGSKVQFSPAAAGDSTFEVKLPDGTLSGYTEGTGDGDAVVSLVAGKECGE